MSYDELWQSTIEAAEHNFEWSTTPWSGIPELDELVGPHSGAFAMAVVAPPGSGLTALLVSLANAAAQAGLSVDLIVPPRTTRAIGQRLLSLRSGVSLTHLSTGRLHERDWAALQRIRSSPPGRLRILSALSANPIVPQQLADTELVIVDAPVGTRMVRHLERAGPPAVILGLRQVSHSPYFDLVAELHRDDRASGDWEPASLDVTRNRLGPVGRVPLIFRGATASFHAAATTDG